MKTLILCVDRDDDLGVKATITSPVVGRKNNLKALIALGLEDPEDSDANVMFMGLKLYRKYKELGREVEVATICGDKNVGMLSDQNLVRQFYAVLEQFSPDTVVMVSDGAEDETILPLISQRVQVEHIERVVVKQQQNIESTFYIVMEAFKNPKIAKKIIVPVSGILILWSILIIIGWTELAFGILVTIIALILMAKALNIEQQITRIFEDTRGAFKNRRYFLFSGMFLSLAVLFAGIIISYIQSADADETWDFVYRFVDSLLWYLIISGGIYLLGNSMDTYMRSGKFLRSTWTIILSLAATGFIANVTIDFIGYLLEFRAEFEWQNQLIYLIAGVVLLILGGMAHTYNKSKTGGRKRTGWMR
jgi:putative membrane protein